VRENCGLKHTQRYDQGILWYGMEGKNRYGMTQVWNGKFNVWNGKNLPYSILAYFDMLLLKAFFSFS